VGLNMDDAIWDVTVFTKNRERLEEGDIAAKFLCAVLNQPRVTALLSEDHFSVDGTLIEAWAGIKSFKPKADSRDNGPDGGADRGPPAPGLKYKPASGRNAERDFHGDKRSNRTHASTSDPDARLYKKGRGAAARLCHMGHFVMENRHGLIVDTELTLATGTAEREAALSMLKRRDARHRITLAADKAYDVAGFVADLRELKVTPHVAQNTTNRSSAIDGRTTRHAGYAISQRIRKRIEEGFGWVKTYGGLRKTRHQGTERVGWSFTLAAAACNLIRLPKLIEIKG
jgi:hypothetical protein